MQLYPLHSNICNSVELCEINSVKLVRVAYIMVNTYNACNNNYNLLY